MHDHLWPLLYLLQYLPVDLVVALDGLLVEDLHMDGYLAFFVSELQAVRNKVQKDLLDPNLISIDWLYEVQVLQLVNFSHQLYLVLVCGAQEYLETLLDGGAQVKVALDEAEGVVLQLRQVEEIIDEILHHSLREYLSLQELRGSHDLVLCCPLGLNVELLLGLKSLGHIIIYLV